MANVDYEGKGSSVAGDGRVSASEAEQAAAQCARMMNEALDRRDVYRFPPGEAFTREQCKQLVRESVALALKQDREHRPADGWVQRRQARRDFYEMLAQALVAEHVPMDSAGAIKGLVDAYLCAWEAAS